MYGPENMNTSLTIIELVASTNASCDEEFGSDSNTVFSVLNIQIILIPFVDVKVIRWV